MGDYFDLKPTTDSFPITLSYKQYCTTWIWYWTCCVWKDAATEPRHAASVLKSEVTDRTSGYSSEWHMLFGVLWRFPSSL